MLYVVATPIGNLSDVTLRALEVLGSADLVACEDTRETAKLLRAHGIEKPLVSYFRDNERRRLPELLEALEGGRRIALVCDRGTPGIADPAYLLAREARKRGIPVVAVPGPSSLAAALSVSGLPADRVTFFGFLPRKDGRLRRVLEEAAGREETLVFFESVHRVRRTLARMAEVLGEREAAVCRELTKKFEEVLRGTLGELAARFSEKTPRGEFVIVVAPRGRAGRGDNGKESPWS